MTVLFQNKRGFGLLEVVVSIAITSVLAVSFVTLLSYSKSLSRHNLDVLKAELYLIETVEQIRELEHSSWTTLDTTVCEHPAKCHVEESSGAWIIVSGGEELDSKFERALYINDVYRDQAAFPNTLVTSGGVLDPDSKKILVQLKWINTSGSHSKEIEIYVYE